MLNGRRRSALLLAGLVVSLAASLLLIVSIDVVGIGLSDSVLVQTVTEPQPLQNPSQTAQSLESLFNSKLFE